MSRLQVIYRVSETHQAYLLRSLLKRYSIAANVVEEQAVEGQAITEVCVSSADAEVALGIARLFEKNILRERLSDESSCEMGFPGGDDPEIDSPMHWPAWPACPKCQTHRQTICPICFTAGHDFPLGDLPFDMMADQASGSLISDVFAHSLDPLTSFASENVLLLCYACDEPFRPRFYARCEICGHEYGEGLACPPPIDDAYQGHWMALIGIALLTAFAIGLLAISR